MCGISTPSSSNGSRRLMLWRRRTKSHSATYLKLKREKRSTRERETKNDTANLRKKKREETVEKLRNVSFSEQTKNDAKDLETKDLDEISKMLESTNLKDLKLNSTDTEENLAAIRKCYQLLFKDKNLISEVISSDILETLVKCLSNSNRELQYEAARTVNVIIRSGIKKEIVQAGAAPLFINLLKSPDDRVCEEALWALGNIAQDTDQRASLLKQGFTGPLLELLNKSYKTDIATSVLSTVVWVIMNLVSNGPPLPVITVREMLPALKKLVEHTDVNTLTRTTWSIGLISDSDNERRQMVIDEGLVPKLVSLLTREEQNVKAAALKAVGSIVMGNDAQKNVVLNCGILARLQTLLEHSPENTNWKSSVWVLANVTAGNQEQIQAVIDAGLLRKIVENLEQGDLDNRRRVCWAVANIVSKGSKEQVAELMDCGVIAPLCDLLGCEDNEVIKAVLDGLTKMLKEAGENELRAATLIHECGGFDKLKILRRHKNIALRKQADDIIQQYIGTEEHQIATENAPTGKEWNKMRNISSIVKNMTNMAFPDLQLDAVQLCHQIFSDKETNIINKFIEAGVLHSLVQCLSRNDQKTVQLEAVSAFIIIITEGTKDQRKKVIQSGAVSFFLSILKSTDKDLRIQALTAIANLITNEIGLRDLVIELGVIEPLAEFTKASDCVTSLSIVAEVFKVLFKSAKENALPEEVNRHVLQALKRLIGHTDVNILSNTLWAIIYLTSINQDTLQMTFDSGIVPKIVALMSNKDGKVEKAALIVVKHIALTGTARQKQIVINCGVLSYLPTLLTHSVEDMRNHSMCLLSNLTANRYQVQAIIDAGLASTIIEALSHQNSKMQNYGAYAVANICKNGTKEQVTIFVKYRVIVPFCNLLSCNTDTVSAVLVGLQAMLAKTEGEQLCALIEECGGVDKMKDLREHENPKIRKHVEDMLNKFFGGNLLECTICQEDLKKEERVRALPCAHSFHDECISSWLDVRRTCPVCRKNVPP